MIREIDLREYKATPDLEKIRAVANNPDLPESDIFDFGVFLIARSGLNRNHTEITAEGQKSAVKDWVGKPIYFRDHEVKSSNQIGRIYDAWTEARAGETVTYGRGFGIKTDDLADLFKRIENRVHQEMSCAYAPILSKCSKCNSELSDFTDCPNGHQIGQDGVHVKDYEFEPDHISFVGRPGVEGAGLIAASDQKRWLKVFAAIGDDPESAEQAIQELRLQAADGETFRSWAKDEFMKWYGLAHVDADNDEIQSLADKLSAREMIRLGRIEHARFHEVLPNGGKQLTTTKEDGLEEIAVPEFKNVRDIFKKGK